jgi:anti-sigma factor RsiW
MDSSRCDSIDAFLGEWLSPRERAEFEVHLATCQRCRQTVQEEARLNSLLKQAAELGQPVPSGLVARIEQSLRRQRSRHTAWAAGLVAAALVAGSVATWSWVRPQRQALVPRPEVVETPAPVPQAPSEPRPPVAISFKHPTEVIAVPQESAHPAVTIIWVYPALGAERATATPLNSH